MSNHLLYGESFDSHSERMKRALEKEEERLAKICSYCGEEKKEDEDYCVDCCEFLNLISKVINK